MATESGLGSQVDPAHELSGTDRCGPHQDGEHGQDRHIKWRKLSHDVDILLDRLYGKNAVIPHDVDL
jgi:hypothetical protein